jgi:hypothetical protein
MLKTVSSITNAIGALNYKGTWNASTNTPTITSSVGVKGDYYVVSVAGSTTIDGISNWGVGDWIAYNGSVWQRVEGGADLNGVNLSVSGTATIATLNTSGQVVFNDAGADVDFRVEGDTDANLLFVDASTDRIGVGLNAPLQKFHVVQTVDDNTDGIRIARSGIATQYGVFANFGGATWLTTVDTANNGNNVLVFNRSGNGTTFTENGRFDSSGNFSISNGNLVISTSGKGIDFSATPGTGTSELLNDYEEGVWTPTIFGQGTAGTYTLSGLDSWYTKVGNLVTCHATFGFSAASGGSGGLRIANLPFSYGKPLVGLVATGTVNFATASPLTISIISAATPPSTICYIVSSIDNAGLEELDIGSVSVSSSFRLCFSYVV